jgi:transcription-repair coupling factor (superfamily II helicase)
LSPHLFISLADSLERVGRHPAVQEILARMQGSPRRRAPVCARLAGPTDSAKALVIAHLAAAIDRPVIVLADSNRRAELLLDPLRFFYGAIAARGEPATEIAVLPAHDVLPHQNLSPHPEISEARAVTLWRLVSGVTRVVVAPAQAAAMRLREADFYRGLARTVERDADVSLDEVVAHLRSTGYERTELVEMAGQYAVRGGILDVFSPEAARPVRLELLGDTVESLREFDTATQRSVRPLERVTLLPLTEFPRRAELFRRLLEAQGRSSEEELRYAGDFPGWEFEAARLDPPDVSLFELCGAPLVIVDEPEAVEASAQRLDELLAEGEARVDSGGSGFAPGVHYAAAAELWQKLEAADRVLLELLPIERPGEEQLVLTAQPTARYHGNVPAFFAEAGARLAQGEDVIIAAASTGELERLADLCREYNVPHRVGELPGEAAPAWLAAEPPPPSEAGAAVLVRAPVAEGFVLPDLRLAFYGNADLFEPLAEAARARPAARRGLAAFSSDFSDLAAGDFVVHVDHGIGQFEGLRQIQTDGRAGEFMLLRYADDARLYVPLERMDLVQKYRTLGEARPRLDRLGGTAWESRKARVKKSVADMAERLLRLYAERKAVEGFAFSSDAPWQREFEDTFEFEETPDQARAIEEVKRDLERPAAMDRLLCGDVGYGKTEVAMRAAFKVVCDSKQVAVLAPTTVLAFQHWETFRRRFAAFPVRVEMLSRFRSAREQKQVLADIEAGKVDIVIGTHRLLSRDVRFQDLGLLVVDEEQRFGVAHKERIKEMRRNVDVLTMSATPIPRTLHMSLAGLRDLSLIETPPKDRLAVQTVVAPFSERLVQSAIEQELAREGQVYFVHNRVQSIHSLAALLARLVPRARLVVGHGQMPERELESVMLRFIRHEADILLSTSIIENGLDIPRVNTILINRADRFGLSELYQLRGRVGRSAARAYAYLLVPRDASLSAIARKRLAALTEFSELGAGFRIAALDLELRGAGNLLGREQHGHVNAIGFDLYCRMLERAVAERRGEAPAEELRTTLNLGVDIRIPAAFIPSEALRLRTYKRVAEVRSEAEREQLARELEDRFGALPAAVAHLLDYAVLKGLCERLLVAAVERQGRQVAIRFHPGTPVEPERLVRVIRSRPGMRLDPAGAVLLELTEGSTDVLETIRNVLLQLEPEDRI